MLTGVLVGLAVLTKSLQAFLVLPALAGGVPGASPGSLGRRVGQLAAGGAALVAAAGWWFVAVTLVPAAIGPGSAGSAPTDPWTSPWATTGSAGSPGEHSPSGRVVVDGGSYWRLFGSAGDQIGWLLPAAASASSWAGSLSGVGPAPTRWRAAVLLWGGWAVVTGVVLSLMRGISHPYYSVELAPAVAALVALGATLLWRRRSAEGYLALAVSPSSPRCGA